MRNSLICLALGLFAGTYMTIWSNNLDYIRAESKRFADLNYVRGCVEAGLTRDVCTPRAMLARMQLEGAGL